MGLSVQMIHWIILYHRLDCIVLSAGLDRIVSAGSGKTGFYALAGYCQYGTDGADGLVGALVGRGWYGPTLAPAGTGAPPWHDRTA